MKRFCQWLSVLAAMVFLVGCGRSTQRQSLSQDVARQYDETGRIDLATLALEWDRVYLFAPYSTQKDVERSLGVPWKAGAASSISDDDGIVLVVFMKDGGIVGWFEHRRDRGDLVAFTRREGYGRGQAIFPLKP